MAAEIFDPETNELTPFGAQLYPAYSIGGKLFYVSEVSFSPNGPQKLSVYNSDMTEVVSFEPEKRFYHSWLVGPR